MYELNPLVHRSHTLFRSSLGEFQLHAYGMSSGKTHVALVKGNPRASVTPLVRVQSSCITGTTFLAKLCDCRQQLHLALERIAQHGSGCVVYLDQEGRDHGLVEKVEQLSLIVGGLDTLAAAQERNKQADLRTYEDAAMILGELLGKKPLDMMTNNPEKMDGLAKAGVEVARRVPIETEPTSDNLDYLFVKRTKMGHLLPGLDGI